MSLELLHAQVFHRHGARTPGYVAAQPADWSSSMRGKEEQCRPWRLLDCGGDEIPFDAVRPDGKLVTGGGQESAERIAMQRGLLPGGIWLGDLTAVGMQQAVSLGKRVRARYHGLLQQNAEAATTDAAPAIEVQSTPMRRTIETAAGVLTGLLSNSQGGSSTDIRLHSDSTADDFMIFDIRTPVQAAITRASMAKLAVTHGDVLSQLAEELEAVTGWQLPPPVVGQPMEQVNGPGDDLQCRLAEGLVDPTAELLRTATRLERQFALW